jgi:hypothetical protein
VRPTPENADRVWAALVRFGAPLDDLTRDDLRSPDAVFQIGIPPSRIDLLTSISGVEFGRAWGNRIVVTIAGNDVHTIGKEDLLRNKRATGRPRDLADVTELERSPGT